MLAVYLSSHVHISANADFTISLAAYVQLLSLGFTNSFSLGLVYPAFVVMVIKHIFLHGACYVCQLVIHIE